jgi:hypothetical protein
MSKVEKEAVIRRKMFIENNSTVVEEVYSLRQRRKAVINLRFCFDKPVIFLLRYLMLINQSCTRIIDNLETGEVVTQSYALDDVL